MWTLVLALLAVFGLLAAACGNDDDESVEAGGGSTTEEPADEPADDAAGDDAADDAGSEDSADDMNPLGIAGVDPEAQPGGRLIYGTFNEHAGYDPIITSGGGCCGGAQTFAVFGAPLIRDPEDGQLKPLMAESLESDDAQTWVLTLREGLMFSDGTPFDADAFVFNLQRHLDNEGSAGNSSAALMTSFTALDDRTIEMVLEAPFSAFAFTFTRQLAPFGSPTAIEELGDDFNTNPVGAGPFVLESWTRDELTVLKRNPDYFDAPRPYLDELHFRPIPDSDQRTNALLAGDVDLVYNGSAREFAQPNEEGFGGFSLPTAAGTMINLNNLRAPFDNVDVRRAVKMAFDYDAYNAFVFDGIGGTSPFMVSQQSPFFNSDWEPLPYDPEAARAIVDAYEAENGPIEVEHIVGQGPPRFERTALFVQDSLGEIGIDVSINTVELSTFIQTVFGGDYDMSHWGFAAYDDPGTTPWEATVSRDYDNDGEEENTRNRTHYSNPEVDRLMNIVRSSVDFDERYEALSQAQQIILDEVPFIPIGELDRGLSWNPDKVNNVLCTSDCVLRSDVVWVSE